MHGEMNAITMTNTSYPDARAFSQFLHVRANSKKALSRTKRTLSIASWNIRSLVENQGDAHICRSGNTRTSSVNCKVDLLDGELDCYGIAIAGVQETKWFSCDVWPATNGYTLLHSGRPLPGEEERKKRNEGVGITLSKFATVAWREAGEKWEAVSSRIISVRLKLSKRRQRRPGRTREPHNFFATIISVYAPTAKATENVKSQFFTKLQDTVDKVPQSDILIILGDFNARVGSLEDTDQNWVGILGRFGIGDRNPADKDLLQFCARNQLTLMNTWLKKKPHHLSTWMHPATKRWHMIDYFIMRAKQRVLCTDVQVMRGATCWTDHQMIRAKVRMSYPARNANVTKQLLSQLPLTFSTKLVSGKLTKLC